MIKRYLKIVLYGFMTWLIPFLSAFFFYSRDGKLNIDVFLFKSIMIIISSVTGAILLVSYFKKISTAYLKEGIIVGIIWFCVNIVLDLLILIPMSGMTIPNYFTQIGLGYLAILPISIAVGAALANKK